MSPGTRLRGACPVYTDLGQAMPPAVPPSNALPPPPGCHNAPPQRMNITLEHPAWGRYSLPFSFALVAQDCAARTRTTNCTVKLIKCIMMSAHHPVFPSIGVVAMNRGLLARGGDNASRCLCTGMRAKRAWQRRGQRRRPLFEKCTSSRCYCITVQYVGEYLVFFRLELVNGLIFCNVHMST